MKSIELLTSFSTDFDAFQQEFSNEFNKIIELTKKIYKNLEEKTSIKTRVKEVLDKFFESYKQEDTWLVDIFYEIVDDIRLKMEMHLIESLEKQVIGVNINEIQKLPSIMEQYLREILQFLQLVKEEYSDKVHKEKFSEIQHISESLSQNFRELTEEINKYLTNLRQTQLLFLEDLRKAIATAPKEKKEKKEMKAVEEPKATLIEKLNQIMEKSKKSFVDIKTLASQLNISTDLVQELASEAGYKVTKKRIYKKK